MHEEYTNSMVPHTVGGLACVLQEMHRAGIIFKVLGQDNIYVTALPMPDNMIYHMNKLEWKQKMSPELIFAD